MNKSAVKYDVLKALTFASLLWLLFFVNLLLSKTYHANYTLGADMWNVLYLALLISSLIATLVVVGESIKSLRKDGFAQ